MANPTREELIAQAKPEHDRVCSCDPRYLMSCSKMVVAILALAKKPAEPACTPDPANALTSEIMTTVDDAYDAAWKLGASHADALGASMHALVTALADRLLPADAETRTADGES